MNKQNAMQMLDQVELDMQFAIDALDYLTSDAGGVSVNALRAVIVDDGGQKTREELNSSEPDIPNDPFRSPLVGDYD